MIAAEEALDRARQSADDDREAWPAWQRAATEAWLVRHPEDRWVLRPAAGHRPTVDEIRRRAERMQSAMDGVSPVWRLEPSSPERTGALAQVGFAHEQHAGLYGPIYAAIHAVRGGRPDPEDLDLLVRFLEADIYCDQSGYATEAVIREVRRATRTAEIDGRLRRVVLVAVDGYDRREFRAFCRLAAHVVDDSLRAALNDRLESADPRTARHARWVLDAIG